MFEKGTYIGERYEILDKIGTGGMSLVFKALDHTLNRNVAIKVLKPEFSEDPQFLSKFRTEARSAAGLTHPNIVNIYDVGSEGGANYIVMEYIEGITLKTYIEKKGRLAFKEAVSIAIQVAKGIEDAHRHQIVHRDIKPQNIMISTDGKVKVTDFGIARAASSDTIRSDVMGSVHYISPEQARNGFVDGKSDIYSLGIVMYEMVTGRVPYDADTPVAVAVAHLQDEMVKPSVYAPDLPISLEGIILKCTQKNADKRYESTEELLTDLKKSLINPDENFVVISEPEGARTILYGADEVNRLRAKNSGEEDGSSEFSKEDVLSEEDEDEDEDDKGFLNPKMEKAVTIMGIVAAVVIVIIVIFLLGSVFGWFRFGSSSSGDTSIEENMIEVPDVTGMTYEEATEALNEKELGISKAGYEYSSTVAEGDIISQTPEAGEKVNANTTVKVTISNGPSDDTTSNDDDSSTSASTMIDVTGMTEEGAKEALEAKGINYGTTTYEYSDSVEAGQVISTDPAAGTSLSDSTVVVLTVSRGEKTVSVPSVRGLKKKAAKTTLTNSGLKVSVEEDYSDTVEKGYVISQTPSAGSTVSEGTTVTITVSLGAQVSYVSVPSLVGKSLATAQSTLSNFGLTCTYTQEYSDSKEAGIVISQSPSEGTSVEEGSEVSLVVSLGPASTGNDTTTQVTQ